ncbi:hypothetical protein [Burkholderia contaminans]|uniref:Uncharacterized protein n=1 Tax=Burkholderia contaminans TaxID=488447 RepID=A0A3N8RNJ8_9BURK|nr:hypothetical protein [Burkholderia contaminans]RQT37452.1 hypothetical protein DF037_01595 [Burkholderia contaminans]
MTKNLKIAVAVTIAFAATVIIVLSIALRYVGQPMPVSLEVPAFATALIALMASVVYLGYVL